MFILRRLKKIGKSKMIILLVILFIPTNGFVQFDVPHRCIRAFPSEIYSCEFRTPNYYVLFGEGVSRLKIYRILAGTTLEILEENISGLTNIKISKGTCPIIVSNKPINVELKGRLCNVSTYLTFVYLQYYVTTCLIESLCCLKI